MNRRILTSMVLLALAGIAQGAAAQYPADKSGGPTTPWYVGAGLGIIDASIPSQTVNGTNAALAAANGAAFTVVDEDSHSTGTKFLVGFKFNRNFAAEVGYASLGRTSTHTDFRGTGVPSVSVGTFDLDYKMAGPFIDAVGFLPLSEKWSLIGRIGVSYVKTSISADGAPLTLIISSNDKSETEAREKFGAGVDYNINAAFTVRGEWERYKAPDPLSDEVFDVDTATLSLLYRF